MQTNNKQLKQSKIQYEDKFNYNANDADMQMQEVDYNSIKLNEQNDTEMLRLIEQYLYNQGYQQIAKQLEDQSNVKMEDESVNQFKQKILQGEYFPQKSMGDQMPQNPLDSLQIPDYQQRQIQFYLYEQHYLELLERGLKIEAIMVLQKELVPRCSDKNKLQQLAQLITCQVALEEYVNGQNGYSNGHTQNDQLKLTSIDKEDFHDDQNNSLTKGDMPFPHQNDVSITKANLLTTTFIKNTEIRTRASWKGSEEEGRKELLEKIQKLIPPTVMMQPNRLQLLCKQAISQQIHSCKFHNVYQTQYSLLDDHICTKQMIPTKCIAVLKQHKDEVWTAIFSPSGKKLATQGKDNLVYLWSFTQVTDNRYVDAVSGKNQGLNNGYTQFSQKPYKYRIKCTHEIRAHNKCINSLTWTNTDDRWFVTTSLDCTAKIWDSRTGKLQCEIVGKHAESVTSAVFSADDSKLITLSTDKYMIVWDIRNCEDDLQTTSNNKQSLPYKAVELTRTETRCCLELVISQNRLVAKGQLHLHIFNIANGDGEDCLLSAFEDTDCQYELETEDKIFRVSLSKDGRYLLANISSEEPRIEMYDLDRKHIIRKFTGFKQQIFLLKCDFGGVNESFVICGSDDGLIYIWSKEKGDIIQKLGQNQLQQNEGDSFKNITTAKSAATQRKKRSILDNNHKHTVDLGAHTQVCNSANWCPSDPFIVASASDDQTVRIWGLEDMSPADVIIDKKEIKKIDGTGSGSTRYDNVGNSNGTNYEEEDDDDNDEDDDDDDEDYNENQDEDEEGDNDDDEDEEMNDESDDNAQQEGGASGRHGRANFMRGLIQIQEEYEDDEDWVEESS
eukprot:403353910